MAETWLKLLRNKIEASGKTRYQIAVETEIGENMLSRLMAGKGVSIQTAERLADYFGLDLIEVKKTRSRKAE